MKKEGIQIDSLQALLDAGRTLLAADPERFRRVLALARAYASLHDREPEPLDVVLSRMLEIRGRNGKASA